MPERIAATHLRGNLFSTLDLVVETGKIVEIQRPKGMVRIMRDTSSQRLAALQPHPNTINGDAEELANLSWEQAWKPTL